VGIDLGCEPAPDETTVCKFRHLLEEHHLGERMLGTVKQLRCLDRKQIWVPPFRQVLCDHRLPWCNKIADLEGNYLLLVPSPKSPVPIRHLRYPRDADIVGRVVGFAHLIAPLNLKAVAAPPARSNILEP
jgi:hypothetical protein